MTDYPPITTFEVVEGQVVEKARCGEADIMILIDQDTVNDNSTTDPESAVMEDDQNFIYLWA